MADPFVDTALVQEAGGKLVDLPTLLAASDFVTLHSPLNEDTTGMIGKAELETMKDSAFLINCARGPLIDEPSLVAALNDGQIAGAGLDVMESNHPESDHPLFGMDNVIVSPHVAFYSPESTR